MAASRKEARLLLHAQQAVGASREAQNFVWSDMFVEDGKEFNSKYPSGTDEAYYLVEMARFFETIGTFWKNGLVDEKFLFDWITCAPAWNRMSGVLLEQRERWGEPRLWENFEALAKAQKKASDS
jgi:hypothetical protein